LTPPVIATDPKLKALAALSERLSVLDPTPVLVNLVDAVNADVLPWLAEQMHVMGDEGWLLANTDEQRRALIKRAIDLHRYKGTTWAVKEVFGVLGVDVELEEWWQQQPTAAPYTFALTAWVNDNLLPGEPVLTARLYERLQRMVEMVKPVRSAFGFRVGARLDQPAWSLANAAQPAAVSRWSHDAQPVQPTPAQQPLRAANAQQTHAVARTSAEPLPVQPALFINPMRIASVTQARSVVRVSMEVQ
ncbi:MAG: phage tail protein I, partial [Rhodoferax sp.]